MRDYNYQDEKIKELLALNENLIEENQILKQKNVELSRLSKNSKMSNTELDLIIKLEVKEEEIKALMEDIEELKKELTEKKKDEGDILSELLVTYTVKRDAKTAGVLNKAKEKAMDRRIKRLVDKVKDNYREHHLHDKMKACLLQLKQLPMETYAKLAIPQAKVSKFNQPEPPSHAKLVEGIGNVIMAYDIQPLEQEVSSDDLDLESDNDMNF